tara:strand:+ start:247 stop:660 length:414 start_codon:yes stop_codon:yes gene_type:complete
MTKDKDKKNTYFSGYCPSSLDDWAFPYEKDDDKTDPTLPSFHQMNQANRTFIKDLGNLLMILDRIVANTGFNTNAPEKLYEVAKKAFTDLQKNAKVTKKPSITKELLKTSSWELFQKSDPNESRNILEKLKTILNKA